MTSRELERFWAKVKPALDDSGCLLWTGCHGGEGYGWLNIGGNQGRAHPAHRLSYEHYVGPIPEGLTIDHLCRNRGCVNWLHLEPVTRGENVLRGIGFAAVNAQKTHCPQGHAYAEHAYVHPVTGWRSCRVCTLERNRERYRARRQAATAARPQRECAASDCSAAISSAARTDRMFCSELCRDRERRRRRAAA